MEYRVTLPWVYANKNCPGNTDPSARQGYYVEAESLGEAISKLRKRDPKRFSCDLEIQEWSGKGATPGKVLGVFS